MKFNIIYVELTNICGLKCSFCPTKNLPSKTLSLFTFEKILKQIKPYTKQIACHIVGDPLVLKNLEIYLTLVEKYNLKANITTSGFYDLQDCLLNSCVKQINISLNSFNKNQTNIKFDDYFNKIINFCKKKNNTNKDIFINLRLWNFDDENSEKLYNELIFDNLNKYFNLNLNIDEVYQNKIKNIRLDYKILLGFDSYFAWPTLDTDTLTHNFCYGLKSHIGILSNGDIVPCCLDKDAVVKLGNINDTSLDEVLRSQKVKNIRENFARKIAIEELCKKCRYKDKFV